MEKHERLVAQKLKCFGQKLSTAILAVFFAVCRNAAADTHVVDPSAGQTIQDALAIAVSGDVIELMDGVYLGEGNRGLSIPSTISPLTIRSATHAGNCIIDASNLGQVIYSQGVDLLIEGITFRNGAADYGGAFLCYGGNVTIRHCEFFGNRATQAGGALCLLNTGTVAIVNGLFVENVAQEGGAIFLNFATTTGILHTTFNRNNSSGSGAIHADHIGNLDVQFSILWDDAPQEIFIQNGDMAIEHCCIDQNVDGMNIRKNPVFVSAIYGDHYLAHDYAGFPITSPCVDAFEGFEVANYPDVSSRTTSPYHFIDSELLDLGYHYYPMSGFETPTPTLTPVPTATPTETPDPTATATPTPVYEIGLVLSEDLFQPDDLFLLEVRVSSWLKQNNPLRLLVVLDVFGQYFMYPSWSEDYDFRYVSIPVGQSGVTILDFAWPEGAGAATGLMFHAAFMDTAGEAIITGDGDPLSGIASVMFGYSE